MKKTVFGLLALSVLTFASCKDEHEHENEVSITVNAPLVDAEYNMGDTVFVDAVIAGESAMHGWELAIRKKSDLSVVFEADAHAHAATYAINEYWVNNLNTHTDMELVITAVVDHDGNETSKTVNFHCH